VCVRVCVRTYVCAPVLACRCIRACVSVFASRRLCMCACVGVGVGVGEECVCLCACV